MERRAGAAFLHDGHRSVSKKTRGIVDLPQPALLPHMATWRLPQVVISRQEEGPTITTCYREIHERARLCALALQRLGVKPGDRVGTLAWNNSRHMEAWQALNPSSCVVPSGCVLLLHACRRPQALLPLLHACTNDMICGRRYGIMGSGAICHTLNPRLYAADLEYIINHGATSVMTPVADFDAQCSGACSGLMVPA